MISIISLLIVKSRCQSHQVLKVALLADVGNIGYVAYLLSPSGNSSVFASLCTALANMG